MKTSVPGLFENGGRIVQQMPTWDQIAPRFVEVLEGTAGDDGAIGCNLTRALANAGSRAIVVGDLSSAEREQVTSGKTEIMGLTGEGRWQEGRRSFPTYHRPPTNYLYFQ